MNIVYNYKENENNAENNLIKFDDETRQNYLQIYIPNVLVKIFKKLKY